MCAIGVCGCCSDGEDSVDNVVVVVLWRASWSLALLAMLWPHFSDDCIEDRTSVSLSEGDSNRVEALLAVGLC